MKSKYIKLILITAVVIFLDQVTKFLIVKQMPLYSSVAIIPDFFNLVHYRNSGGAFSLMANSSVNVRFFVFIVLSIAAIFFIMYLFFKIPEEKKMLQVSMAMIFSGACGNMVDRLRFMYVVDFLDFYIKDYHWPAFNVADSSISIGVVIIMFHIFFKKMPDSL